MKFRKPIGVHMLPREVADFMRSLPDEFEIVPEGHVCVKWPDGITPKVLIEAAQNCYMGSLTETGRILRSIAAIAPERKKRLVNLWRDRCGCDRLRDANWSDPQSGWSKVAGPIEIDY